MLFRSSLSPDGTGPGGVGGKATNESLISTLDEVMAIQREGREKRQAAEAELRNMEQELKGKLLQLHG